MPRSYPTSVFFSDHENDIGNRFRIEYHLAPPIEDRINLYDYPKEYFLDHFYRLSCIIEQKPKMENKIYIKNGQIKVNDNFVNDIVSLKDKVFPDFYALAQRNSSATILNSRSKVFFSGHMMGGMQFLTNKEVPYVLNGLENVFLASSCVFRTWGLFNPSFSVLYIADEIINLILK